MSIDISNNIVYYILIIFGELLIVLVFIHMVYKKRTPASMTAWLLSMILVPYIGVLLYLIFGLRKRENRYKKKAIILQKHTQSFYKQNPVHDILRSYGIADASENEKFELFTDSIKAYEKFMSCIEDSKTSIYLSTYIFEYDDVSKEIIKALIKKAKDGVKVKILIDSLGSIGLYFSQYKLRELRESGVKVEFFMPIFQMPFRNYINLRNHRKIYIFDDKKVISGGMNISSEYFGPNIDKARWDDMLFFSEGTSAELFFEIFASDWFYASQENMSFVKNSAPNSGDTFLQVVPSGPDMSKDILYEALLCAIYSAKERIWIVTPYFIPDNSIIQALIIAKHKGIDVKLITPKDSQNIIVNLTRSSYMRELEEVGVEVALYNGALLHAKAILFDETSAMLGSVNFDNRSLFLNYEVATFVYSVKVIEDIEFWMNKLLLYSSAGTKEVSVPRKILENLMRIIAPQL
ncbi:PLDc N-terminal domain-containing protein [Candidatus Sulfurimonas marisnigri]|uniref:PLDc N-terminal domain-containing protein n=1 Tax=Candidatus Sulfurimonas marisnigri TaxID=2740405 RepID=A0A7S7RRJ7_9BACT|nr:phospholipase D-like domain-containing protein [Candidatus Sulfurimonas marisnigri]QOY55753.1 PLDc N-terminal domain-containing protein [Candidatus Sulfurimonas marisnigri]